MNGKSILHFYKLRNGTIVCNLKWRKNYACFPLVYGDKKGLIIMMKIANIRNKELLKKARENLFKMSEKKRREIDKL
jgi:hypothetical protein